MQILMKYKKETAIVIAVAVVVLGRQLRLQDIKKNIEIHNTVQQEIIENEDLKEKPQNSVDYSAWIEYREKEKKEKLYRVEDLLPEVRKPAAWEDFFVIEDIPKGFYLADTIVEEKNGWTITYRFESQNIDKKIDFIQSNDNTLKERKNFIGRKMQKKKYYIAKNKEYHIICWIDGEITVCIKTDIPDIAEDMLIDLAEKVTSYSNVELNYSN